MTSIAPITAPQNRWRPWSSPERGTVLASLVLLIATIALYYPVSYYPFINFDDDVYVARNLQVQKGLTWSTTEWAFRSTYVADNWHPLTWLSHALDCQIFEGNSGGHHAMNLAFHTLNVLLLFWVLYRATGFTERSFMVAALFAIHPINVESVVWISERKNVLSMLFFLLARGLSLVREPAWVAPLPSGSVALLPGVDGQTPGDYVALRFASVGLLAAGKARSPPFARIAQVKSLANSEKRMATVAPGKGPAPGLVCGKRRGDHATPSCRRRSSGVCTPASAGERRLFLRQILGKSRVAIAADYSGPVPCERHRYLESFGHARF